MKTFQIIILFVCMASLFTACSKEEEIGGITPDNREAIRFEIGFTPQGTGGIKTRTATDKDFRTTWEDGDAIGIFAVEHADAGQTASLAASSNYIHNAKLMYNKTANTWTPDTPLYFPAGENRQLDFYSYYPYSAAATDPTAIAFNVQADQSGSGFNASDMMCAVAWDVNKGSAASLAFNHLFTLVEVDISESSENTPRYVADKLKVQLCGVKTAATVNLSHNPIYPVIIPTSASDILMHRVDMGDAAKYVYRAIIPTHDLAAGHTLFTFKQDLNGNSNYTDGNEFSLSYTLTTQTDLVPGNALRYKIKTVETAMPDPNHLYAVGDYYPHVGRVFGVVFEVNNGGTHGKVVSLDEGNGLQWSSDYGNHGAVSSIDGKTNTDIIDMYWHNHPVVFPAFDWCVAKGARWFLPARGELLSLYDQKVAVNTALAGISGAVPLSNNTYWSSSEFNDNYAWFVDFPNRNNTAYYKTESYRVRAVSNF